MSIFDEAKALASKIKSKFQQAVPKVQQAVKTWQDKPSNQIWNDTMAGISNQVNRAKPYLQKANDMGIIGVGNRPSLVQFDPKTKQMTSTNTGVKPIDYATTGARDYINNTYIAAAKRLPEDIQGFKEPGLWNKTKATGKLALDLIQTIPDPTDIPFAAYNATKGYLASVNAGPGGMWNPANTWNPKHFQAGYNAVTKNEAPGLGTALTGKEGTGTTVLNLLELPALLMSGHLKPKQADEFIDAEARGIENSYKRGDIKLLETKLDELLGSNGNGPGRITARRMLDDAASKGDPLAVRYLELVNKTDEAIGRSQLARENLTKVSTDKITQSTIESNVAKMVENELRVKRLAGEIAPQNIINARSRMDNLINYGTNLEKRGYSKEQVDKISAPLGKDLLVQGTTPKQYDIGDYIRSSSGTPSTGKSFTKAPSDFIQDMDRITNNISPKNKVNVFDYLWTPDTVLKKIGLDKEAKALRTGYETYRSNLKQEIDFVQQLKERAPGEESSQRIFRYLDGDKSFTLQKNELDVANGIRRYLADWADRLHLPEDGRITDYITHIFEKGKIEKEFDQELANLISDKVPKTVYSPFTQERLGKNGYIEDVWRALDAYIKRSTRKEAMDPALTMLEKKAKDLDNESFKYVQRYASRINLRPTEADNLIDNWIKSTPIGYKLGARPTANITREIRQTVFRGGIGLNPGSAVRNLTQGTNTFAELGTKYTYKGYSQLFKKMKTGGLDELERVGVLDDGFVQDRNLSVYKQMLEKTDEKLFYLFEQAEKVNRGSAYFGAKQKYLDMGKTEAEAIDLAKEVVRKTQFQFGNIDSPVILSSDLMKTLAQFQTFAVKQGEFVKNMITAKEYGKLLRWVGSNLFISYTIGDVLGISPKDMVPFMSERFGQSPTLQVVGGAKDYLIGKFNDNPQLAAEGKNKILGVAPLLIPGGAQMKKTYQGISAYNQGVSTTPSGDIRFTIEKTPSNLIKSAVLGQYGVPEAKDYFDSKHKPASIDTVLSRDLSEALVSNDQKRIRELMDKSQVSSTDPNGITKEGVKIAIVKAIESKDRATIERLLPMANKVGLTKSEIETYQRNQKYSSKDRDALRLKIAKATEKKDRETVNKLLEEAQLMGVTPESIKELLALRARQKAQ